MDKYTFFVPSFSIPYSNKYLTDTLRLNQFQKRVFDILSSNTLKDILLTAPTGSGKTLTLLLNTSYDLEVGGKELRGFLAIYPNNTLLVNQMCTVESIIIEHFGAVLVDGANSEGKNLAEGKKVYDAGTKVRRCDIDGRNYTEEIDPLSIYKIDPERAGEAFSNIHYIGLLLLSGKYINPEEAIPKRDFLYEIAERKIFPYVRKGGLYLLIFATPDVYLLLITGAYRDFEGVGKALHNMLLAVAEGKGKELERILRETGTLTRQQVDESVSIVLRMTKLPLFIDEFHLYGLYELDALNALLLLYKELIRYPVVFSSATPSDEIFELLDVKLQLEKVDAEVIEGGGGFPVRGNTTFEIFSADDCGRGLSAYYKAVEKVHKIVLGDLLNELKNLKNDRALIILDRLWMVSSLAKKLKEEGLQVHCIASTYPKEACSPGAPIIIGSEATTQGVNLGPLALGILSGTSSEDVIQRIGRIGRRGKDSKVYLVVPEFALEKEPPSGRMNYKELVAYIRNIFPYYPKRERDVTKLIPEHFHSKRRKLIYSLGIASLLRVSGIKDLLNKVNISESDALEMLESFLGDPSSLTNFLMFRKNGFRIKYRIDGDDEIYEASIGIISRNFEIKEAQENREVVISLTPSRGPIKVIVRRDPSYFSGKFADLKLFLRTMDGEIIAGDNKIIANEAYDDRALVFIQDMGAELSDYLSYTGEGAQILSNVGGRYALIFV
ncbi:MAG TPA: hypothetical protein ENO36_03620 [Fervidicoccus fontis]|uniref:Helicase ATP-binding domain-containing protein n=1 Tax=Fervidicoccus fontis TaxID=683846 RepID=A0A7C2UR28_9CREN|nr:hypothetical protein [Fervidicoccus fontis]